MQETGTRHQLQKVGSKCCSEQVMPASNLMAAPHRRPCRCLPSLKSKLKPERSRDLSKLALLVVNEPALTQVFWCPLPKVFLNIQEPSMDKPSFFPSWGPLTPFPHRPLQGAFYACSCGWRKARTQQSRCPSHRVSAVPAHTGGLLWSVGPRPLPTHPVPRGLSEALSLEIHEECL